MTGRVSAYAFAVAAFLACGHARADSIFTLTATGIVSDAGVDYGVFGNPYGTDLTGQTFTIVETFNIDQSTINQGDQNEDLSPSSAGATITLSGVSITMSSSGEDDTLYLDSQAVANGPGDDSPIYSAVQGPAFYLQLQVFNGANDIIGPLDSIGFDQSYTIDFAGGVTGDVYFQAADNSYLYGTLTALRLVAPADRVALAAAAAPEPSALAIFLGGLTMVGLLRGQATRRPVRARGASALRRSGRADDAA